MVIFVAYAILDQYQAMRVNGGLTAGVAENLDLDQQERCVQTPKDAEAVLDPQKRITRLRNHRRAIQIIDARG
jgi:hypothetical protein